MLGNRLVSSLNHQASPVKVDPDAPFKASLEEMGMPEANLRYASAAGRVSKLLSSGAVVIPRL